MVLIAFHVKGISRVAVIIGTSICHCKFLVLIPYEVRILDFKLSPCSECCVLSLGDSLASEIYMPMFRHTLSVPSS